MKGRRIIGWLVVLLIALAFGGFIALLSAASGPIDPAEIVARKITLVREDGQPWLVLREVDGVGYLIWLDDGETEEMALDTIRVRLHHGQKRE